MAADGLPDIGELRSQLARLEARPDEAEGMRLLGTIRQALRQLDQVSAEADEKRRSVREWEQQLAMVERSLIGREEVLKQLTDHERDLEDREDLVQKRERAARDLVQSMALGKEFEEAETVLKRVREYEKTLEESDRLLRQERAMFQKWLNKLEMQQQDMTEALARFTRLSREMDAEKSRLGGKLTQINVLSQQLEIIRARTKTIPKEDAVRLAHLEERERDIEEREKNFNAYREELEESAKMQEKYRLELEAREKRMKEKDGQKAPPGGTEEKAEKGGKLLRKGKK
ncbi:MAG TPA: hypothetical protein VI893_04350 [Thermoplasmata archaeon]|nr:hypothetical protein [Thermoplasmata archaeon]